MRFLPQIILVSSICATAFASLVPLTKRGVPQATYNDLVWYMKYAASAYDTAGCPNPNGNTMIEEFSSFLIDTQGFIARDDKRKEIVVVFRGSSNILDVIQDLDLFQVPFVSPGVSPPAGVLVHQGFLDAWNSVAQNVTEVVALQLVAHPGYKLVTSGHSLGACLSSVAALALKANFPTVPMRMFTYGQARTGNPAYAFWVNDLFGANAFRVTHTDDGVPTLIPESAQWRHHGIEYWQFVDPASAANVRECAPDGEDSTCSSSIEPSGGVNTAHGTYLGITGLTPDTAVCISG